METTRALARRGKDFLLPSPLAGEGGEIERSEIEPGEGLRTHPHCATPTVRSLLAQHPLPQGEREETVRGRVRGRRRVRRAMVPPVCERSWPCGNTRSAERCWQLLLRPSP